MLQDIILYMSSVDVLYLYFILFFFAFIENVFPPSPSDVIVVIGASLIATTTLGYFPVLIITSIGSSLGFILMYYLGYFLSEKILRKDRFKFLTNEDLKKTDHWFNKYGFKLILANRFLPGTRSVISFFSGVHELDVKKTFIFSTISAFAWNGIIIYLGMLVGNNVDQIDYYLGTYSKIIIGITILVFIIWAIIKIYKKRKNV